MKLLEQWRAPTLKHWNGIYHSISPQQLGRHEERIHVDVTRLDTPHRDPWRIEGFDPAHGADH